MHVALSIANILAQSNQDDAAAAGAVAGLFGVFFGLICFALLIGYAWLIFTAFMAYRLLSALPEQYRKQDPKLVWLLLIPFFNLIWNFFVWPRISQSYAEYFKAQNRTDIGDANGSLALTYCICLIAVIIPYLGWGCLSFVSLIILIIYLVRMSALKRQVLSPSGAIVN